MIKVHHMMQKKEELALRHHSGGRSSNVLCYNGSAHRKIALTNRPQDVTCPACLKEMKRMRLK
jgi:hypothetical protein